MLEINKIHNLDVLEGLKNIDDNSISCCVTSPPYFGLRDYGIVGQIGLENSLEEYVNKLVLVFTEVYRVLKNDGTLWLNIGDSYTSQGGSRKSCIKTITSQGSRRNEEPDKSRKIPIEFKNKELMGVPWRLAFALQKFGWYLRSDIIWAKGISFNEKFSGSCMPESCKDRPTRSHEYLFLLTKSTKYYYNYEAVQEDGVYPAGTKAAKGSGTREGNRRSAEYAVYSGKRNLRSVWTIQTKPYKKAHFATFPPKLIEPCIKAGCPQNGIVLDPFMGSGTTAFVCKLLNKNFIGFELNTDYCKISEERLNNAGK